VVVPHARRTVRLAQLVQLVGFLLGGSAGSRLLRHLAPGALLGSRDSVLRTIRRATFPLPQALHALSVDDFALRRGVTYGTMLVDLERRRVVDLLPERSEVAFALWVRQHPEVRVVSRDRGGDDALGATLGAPQAEQIADRFHLLVKAGEVLDRCLTRHHTRLREAAQHSAPAGAVPRAPKSAADTRRKQERHAAREQHFQQVVALTQQGVSAHEIARRLGIARQSVAKFLRVAAFREITLHPRPRRIDRYRPYLRERWNAGEHNVRQLWRESRTQGYPCSDIAVRRVLSTWREPATQLGVAGLPLPAKEEVLYFSTRKTRWLLWKAQEALSEREGAYVAALKQFSPPIAEAQRLLTTFRAILAQRCPEQLAPWLEECEQCGISELVGFARGLRADEAAVRAALRSDWSQGPIEGQVNRLKLLKRQMDGRAKFDLLRQRVLFHAAA
jgi:transposase